MASKLAEAFVEIRTRGVGRVAVALKRSEKTLKRWQMAAQKVSRVASRMFLVVGAAMAAGVVQAARFEQAMARVQAITSATATDMLKLERQARKLGSTTVFTARQAAEAMGFFALAGFKVNEIMTAMPATLNLAAAGQLDVAVAADIAAKILRGMGLEASKLNEVVDVLVKAFTTANTDLTQLGDAMRFVGPVATQTGRSFQEIAANIQVLSNAGLQGAIAGTALRNVIIRVAGGTKETNKLFKELGIQMSTAAGGARPLADVIDDLNSAMSSLGEQEKTAKIFQAFGIRAAQGLGPLLLAGGDAIRDFEEKLNDAGGTAQRIADTQLDTLTGDFKILLSAIQEMAIGLGSTLMPALRGTITVLVNMANSFNGLSATAKSWIGTTAKLGLAALALLAVLAKLVAMMRVLRITMLAMIRNPMIAIVSLIGVALVGAFIAATSSAGELDTAMSKLRGTATEYEDALTGVRDRLNDIREAEGKARIDFAEGRTGASEREKTLKQNVKAREAELQKLIQAQIKFGQTRSTDIRPDDRPASAAPRAPIPISLVSDLLAEAGLDPQQLVGVRGREDLTDRQKQKFAESGLRLPDQKTIQDVINFRDVARRINDAGKEFENLQAELKRFADAAIKDRQKQAAIRRFRARKLTRAGREKAFSAAEAEARGDKASKTSGFDALEEQIRERIKIAKTIGGLVLAVAKQELQELQERKKAAENVAAARKRTAEARKRAERNKQTRRDRRKEDRELFDRSDLPGANVGADFEVSAKTKNLQDRANALRLAGLPKQAAKAQAEANKRASAEREFARATFDPNADLRSRVAGIGDQKGRAFEASEKVKELQAASASATALGDLSRAADLTTRAQERERLERDAFSLEQQAGLEDPKGPVFSGLAEFSKSIQTAQSGVEAKKLKLAQKRTTLLQTIATNTAVRTAQVHGP